MKVLLVGHGGREHALAWRLSQSLQLTSLVVTGNNPGWPVNVTLRPASDVAGWVQVAHDEAVDLVVVGPEAPPLGLADAPSKRRHPLLWSRTGGCSSRNQ